MPQLFQTAPPGVLHLAAPGGFAPMAAEAAGLPAVVSGRPAHYYRKDLIQVGDYTHPTKGFHVPVTAARLKHWQASGNRMLDAGVDVPINVDHSDKADDARGWIKRFEVGQRDDGSPTLFGLCQIIGDDAADTVARNKVSVGIDPDFVDGKRRDWGDSIIHVALTPVPVVPGQGDFQALSRAGYGDDVLTLSAPGTRHGYSSTQVQLPPDLAAAHKAFADSIPDGELAEDGREVDPHVTVRYGLHTSTPSEAHAAIRKPRRDGGGPDDRSVRLGKLSLFPATAERPSDVLKVGVESPYLHHLNGRLASVDHTDTHPGYTPHATVAYLRPGEGAKYDGQDAPGLTGQSFTPDAVRFSDRDGNATDLSLTCHASTPITPPPPEDSMPQWNMTPETEAAFHQKVPGLADAAMTDKAPRVAQHLTDKHAECDRLHGAIKAMSMDDGDDDDVQAMSRGGTEATAAVERIVGKRKARLEELSRKATAAEAAAAARSAELATATARIAELSPKLPDAATLDLVAESHDTLWNTVPFDGESVKGLKALCRSADGRPSVLGMSRAASGKSLERSLIDLLGRAKPLPAFGEQTKLQALVRTPPGTEGKADANHVQALLLSAANAANGTK